MRLETRNIIEYTANNFIWKVGNHLRLTWRVILHKYTIQSLEKQDKKLKINQTSIVRNKIES